MKQILVSLLALLAVSTAQAATVTVLTPTLRPGQTVMASFDALPTSVTFDGKALTSFPYQGGFRVVTPLPLSTKAGTHTLVANFADGTITKTISVIAGKPTVINLPVPPKLNQTPQQVVQNLNTSNTDIKKAVETISPIQVTTGFGLPLADNRKISSTFGEVRITGSERITHLGTDFVLPKGSGVYAINSGIVAKAYYDSIYGNSVFVDHGQGIYSLYLHMNSMTVNVGDKIRKGQKVGTLGESGLASAPHLHLSIKINGQSVDPMQFVRAFK